MADMSVSNCRGCSREIKTGFNFCPYCSLKISPPGCAVCGCELKENYKFCPNCHRVTYRFQKISSGLIQSGLVHLCSGRNTRAISDFEKALESNPENVNAKGYLSREYEKMADELYHQDDLNASIKKYSEAIELTPNWPPLFIKRAKAYSANGNEDKSKHDEAKAVELDPEAGESEDG